MVNSVSAHRFPPTSGAPGGAAFGPAAGRATEVSRRERAAQLKPGSENPLDFIAANFDRLDRNGNGSVSWTEMRANIADPSFQGREAAALATLYSLLHDAGEERGLKGQPRLTPDLLQDFQDEREFALEEGEPAAADLYYKKYLGKLRNTNSELFPKGMPDGLKVRQGYGPSCSILSTTVGQALLNPQVVKDAVQQREDGKVAVHFPGLSEPIVVNRTTDTENALFATAGSNGTWITHVEKAWGQTQTANPKAAFEQSSWPAKSIRAWSNAHATTTSVPESLPEYCRGEVPDFMKGMKDALDHGRIVMTWTRKGEREIGNLVPGHAHTVLGLDSEQGTVKVRNPWGRKEPLNEKGKPRDGKDDGIFELSLEEYLKDFHRIAVQTTDARPPKGRSKT